MATRLCRHRTSTGWHGRAPSTSSASSPSRRVPSRASILTGCYPSALLTHGGLSHADDPRFVTQALARAGYHTASIGKIHLRPQAGTAAIAAT
ncbi:MAG: hypothetical protein R2856_01795 [Caldilineaceae bacterium]